MMIFLGKTHMLYQSVTSVIFRSASIIVMDVCIEDFVISNSQLPLEK